MRLTFIVTIDPVKGLSLLNVLLHSLNLQTRKHFDVVFYNQTLLNEPDLFAQLHIRPQFSYRFFSVERQHFLGNFPLWDLYSFHRQLLDAGLLGDYFISMHMEEFLDIDYVEKVTRVLEATGLDILLGNLCRTPFDAIQIIDIIKTASASEFSDYLRTRRLQRASHWTFQPLPASPIGKLSVLKRNCQKIVDFGFRSRLVPNGEGYSKLAAHYEDLYFMRRDFARRHDWFLSGRRMFFEDVQLCDIPGVCELGRELSKLTHFPRYFNLSKIYHVNHAKFYYQLEDKDFTDALLSLKTDDRLLQTLQEAIRMYRFEGIGLETALRHTRRNAEGTGSQNLNYQYHMQAIQKTSTSARCVNMNAV
jgi:hypothetical protein